MTSFFNQIDFDVFVKRLDVATLQTLLIEDKALLRAKGWSHSDRNKIVNDIDVLTNEIRSRS